MGAELNEATGYRCVNDFSFHFSTPVAKQSLSYGKSIRSVPPKHCPGSLNVFTTGLLQLSSKYEQKNRNKILFFFFLRNSIKLGGNEALFPEWQQCFCPADRRRGLLLKEFLKKRPVFQMPPFRAKKEGIFFFSQAQCSHTCACISNKPPMDSSTSTEWQRGGRGTELGGRRREKGEGGGTVCQKERFIEMLISHSLALCMSRNPEECTLKSYDSSFRGHNASVVYELKKKKKRVSPRWENSDPPNPLKR